jgi:competence ComEA-like helix-hairpin-helix protein
MGEQLVRNGLARAYGAKVIPPGFSGLQPERQKLQQFEDEARQEKIGGWGINVGRLNQRAQKPAAFSSFTLEKGSVSQPSTRPVKSEKLLLGRLDVNTATEEELKAITGIGPVMAARIIAARPFKSADDLKKVSGIGDKKYETVRPYFK